MAKLDEILFPYLDAITDYMVLGIFIVGFLVVFIGTIKQIVRIGK